MHTEPLSAFLSFSLSSRCLCSSPTSALPYQSTYWYAPLYVHLRARSEPLLFSLRCSRPDSSLRLFLFFFTAHVCLFSGSRSIGRLSFSRQPSLSSAMDIPLSSQVPGRAPHFHEVSLPASTDTNISSVSSLSVLLS